jgi:hypothetical protein
MYEILPARIFPTDFSGVEILPFSATEVPVGTFLREKNDQNGQKILKNRTSRNDFFKLSCFWTSSTCLELLQFVVECLIEIKQIFKFSRPRSFHRYPVVFQGRSERIKQCGS